MKKAALLMGMAAMLMATDTNQPTYKSRAPIAKPATLTNKEWRKRKAKIKIQKKSRKANRN